MKRIIAIAAVCAALTSAWADEVTVKDNTSAFKNATITGLTGLKLEYTTSGGNTVTKSLDEVEVIKITDHDSLNEAETLYNQGKFAESAKAYATALDRAGDDWHKQLVTVRRLRALARVGPIDQAAKDWLALVAAQGADAFAYAPRTAGEKGSDANKHAIKLLEEAAAQRKGAELAAIQNVLLKAYVAEGMQEQADKLKAALGTKTEAGGEGPASPMAAADVAATLREASDLLKSNPKEALAKVSGKINSFGANDLGDAMMVTARAQQAMAAKAKGDEQRHLLAAAGLDYMRVYAFYPAHASAAEALLQAGEISKQLGNNLAARTAFREVVEHFGQSDQAKKAQAALATIER